MKFKGTFEELKEIIVATNVNGEWKELPNGQKQFRESKGANFSWYESTGTITFGGKAEDKKILEEKISLALQEKSETSFIANTPNNNNKVFVVYGHDKNARTQLNEMLRRWGLKPLVLDELPSKGQTIIEKLEEYTSDVGFAVVLATPDDEGYRSGHEDEKAYRARQNVVLELGMLLTKLGRDKVAVLLKSQEKMERPSDIQGLIYIPFKDDLQKEAGHVLAKEMCSQGYNITIENL